MQDENPKRPVVEVGYTLRYDKSTTGDIIKCGNYLVSKEETIDFLNYVKDDIDKYIATL